MIIILDDNTGTSPYIKIELPSSKRNYYYRSIDEALRTISMQQETKLSSDEIFAFRHYLIAYPDHLTSQTFSNYLSANYPELLL